LKSRRGLLGPVLLDESQDGARQKDYQDYVGVQVLSQEEGNPVLQSEYDEKIWNCRKKSRRFFGGQLVGTVAQASGPGGAQPGGSVLKIDKTCSAGSV
jgi:hypothetical protein